MVRLIAVFACVTLALVAGGCGDDGDSVSPADWAKDANAICEEMGRELDKEFDASLPTSSTDDPEDAVAAANKAFADGFLAITRAHLARIRALPRPSSDAERIEEMLDLYDRVTQESAQVLKSFGDRKDEAAALERFEKSGAKLGKRAGEIATELGATCLVD
jgi:hypothetical protein